MKNNNIINNGYNSNNGTNIRLNDRIFSSNKNRMREHSLMVINNNQLSLNHSYLNSIFNNYTKLYTTFVTGKTVAIVGPANSIINTNKGALIDKFDIVIRLNKALPLSRSIIKDTGSKTDIVYNSLNTESHPGQNNLNTKLYKRYGVKFVCSPYPYSGVFKQDIINYINMFKFDIPFRCVNRKKFNKFEGSLKTRPYTGTSAIMDILNFPIKLLYITGIDFYNTPYYSQYRRIKKSQLYHLRDNQIHSAYPQMEYLLYKSLVDTRIILDTTLEKLLYNNYIKLYNKLQKININIIFTKEVIDILIGSNNIIFLINKNIDNYINYDLVFNMINNTTIIISKNKEILYQLNMNYDINIKVLNILKKILKLIDIKKIQNDLLFILILLTVYKNINCQPINLNINTRYKELLLFNFLKKFKFISL